MNYIVFDLEWNQSSRPEDTVEGLPFEIVEIGALKCNEQMEEISRFSETIRPSAYRQMHQITEKLIHIKMDELLESDPFDLVFDRFLNWCGEDYCFCTWGTQDLTELQRNMRFHGMGPLKNGPIPFLDIQKLFAIAYEERHERRSVKHAVEVLQIPEDVPFHRALDDAYYTWRVLQHCNRPEILKNVSYNVFCPPKRREDEIRVSFDTYEKYISREFDTREEALMDREVTAVRCYLCHRNLRRKIRWFSSNGHHYYCLAYCEKHGYVKGKIRLQKTDDDKFYVVKTTKFITDEEAESLFGRREHSREIRSHHHSAKG